MSSQKSNKPKQKKKSLALKFFGIVFLMVFTFLIIAGAATMGYLYLNKDKNQLAGDQLKEKQEQDKSSMWDMFKKNEKRKINVAVFGVDEDGTRTDVIFVTSFDTKTKAINLLSVPRDTRIELTEMRWKEMQNNNSHRVPKVVKINEVHAYAGKAKRNEYSVDELERLLDITIDHFVKIDLVAFRKIVDELGGVEVDVPMNMKYSDPYQNLYINLKKGKQKLNGSQAEGLVRYRAGYAEGDVGRIQTQQLFLKAFAKQVLSERNILRITNIVRTLYEYVETDVGLDDILQYTKYIKDIQVDNIHMETLPGEGKYVKGTSYFIPDEPKVKEQVARIFSVSEENSNDQKTTKSSQEYSIQVLNGGNVGGLATRTQKKLQEEGYQVSSIGTYKQERQDSTRIIVKEKGMGEDLKKFFVETKVEVDPQALPKNIDIQIILGLKEK